CKTLDATALRSNLNTSTEYTVYIMNKTTLSSNFTIQSTQSSPFTFTNNPEISSIQSEIKINKYGGQFNIEGLTLFEYINFSMSAAISNSYGGAINAHLTSSSGRLDIISCNFIGCRAGSSGGALYYQIGNQDESTLRNLTFNQCQAYSNGSGILFALHTYGKLRITGSCAFTDCKTESSSGQGGALYGLVSDENSQLTFEDSVTFERCSSVQGGGMKLYINSSGKLRMTGSWLFTNCSCKSLGGGCMISNEKNYEMYLLGTMNFEGCLSEGYGGGLCVQSQGVGQISINEMQFSNCNSTIEGGGFYSELLHGVQITFTGKITFDNCNSNGSGGGIGFGNVGAIVSFNTTEQILIFNCNSMHSGGGIYCQIADKGLVQVNNMKFNKCNSQNSGGGIYAYIEDGGQLILDKSCELYLCESYWNGGGIYIQINFTEQCKFVINDVYIHECKALNSTNTSLSFSQSGFGGSLFLGVEEDYDPSTELIDLHGMKIYNNSAEKFGQSLFVVMIQIEDFCKYGTQGEYAKGNYSDTYSDEQELEGIPMDLISFNSSSPQTIEQQQQPLEHWWRILGILKSAQVIVNVSNPNGKLIFRIEGQRMISRYLNVKIFELRDKTQEEIDQEQKEKDYKYNKNNVKSLKRNSLQSQISPKYQTINQQQISINSNLKIEQKHKNYQNEIIYPPEDGSSSPIQIEGEISNDQTATFGMNEYNWLNYKQKVLGVLISNDRNIFTGKDGLIIEDDENAAVQLEVIIEDDVEKEEDKQQQQEEQDEDKKEGKGLPIGIILGIAVGALIIVTVIIIIIFVSFVITKKLSDFEKIKKIGKGAFGTVWKMKEIKSQRIVAIKKIDYDSDDEKQRFDKEVSVMREVYHILQQASSSSSTSLSSSQSSDSQPQIIHVVEPLGYFLNEDKDKAYLVLEYCENGDLRQYIQKMKNSGTEITNAKAFELIRQITLALNQLHMNGIIHGDIKPENILLTEDFQVKLSDFGLTRKLQEGRGYTTNHGGTTYYLAPELLHGQSAHGKRMQTIAADIWSLGILLFELLAQKHPFFGSNDIDLSPLEIYHRIIDEEPAELPDHYSNNLKKLIKMMLIKDVARRITAEAILDVHEKNAKRPMRSCVSEIRARNLPMENKFLQNNHSLDALNKAMIDNNQ
ncbi:MAG: putative NEK protein kinase, partial [Streblomastix strix]